MEGQKQCLQELTRAVCRSINVINEALAEEDRAKRDKKAARALKELEVINDQVMRSGLDLTIGQIVQLKTRSRGSAKSSKLGQSTEPKPKTPFQVLMEHHAKHVVGPIPDAAAQGSAIKWLLQSFTPELAIKRYDAQIEEGWRQGRVSWLTVRQEIGRMQGNATRTTDATERNADRLDGNLQLISELRRDVG